MSGNPREWEAQRCTRWLPLKQYSELQQLKALVLCRAVVKEGLPGAWQEGGRGRPVGGIAPEVDRKNITGALFSANSYLKQWASVK